MSSRLRAIAHETIAILERGTYGVLGSGQVRLAADIDRAVAERGCTCPTSYPRPAPLREPRACR